jgi:hypothetical protein
MSDNNLQAALKADIAKLTPLPAAQSREYTQGYNAGYKDAMKDALVLARRRDDESQRFANSVKWTPFNQL